MHPKLGVLVRHAALRGAAADLREVVHALRHRRGTLGGCRSALAGAFTPSAERRCAFETRPWCFWTFEGVFEGVSIDYVFLNVVTFLCFVCVLESLDALVCSGGM